MPGGRGRGNSFTVWGSSYCCSPPSIFLVIWPQMHLTTCTQLPKNKAKLKRSAKCRDLCERGRAVAHALRAGWLEFHPSLSFSAESAGWERAELDSLGIFCQLESEPVHLCVRPNQDVIVMSPTGRAKRFHPFYDDAVTSEVDHTAVGQYTSLCPSKELWQAKGLRLATHPHLLVPSCS